MRTLAQTVDGTLESVVIYFQRIRELALQSANGTNSANDRAALNAEAQEQIAELNRISKVAQFNGQPLFNTSQILLFKLAQTATK